MKSGDGSTHPPRRRPPGSGRQPDPGWAAGTATRTRPCMRGRPKSAAFDATACDESEDAQACNQNGKGRRFIRSRRRSERPTDRAAGTVRGRLARRRRGHGSHRLCSDRNPRRRAPTGIAVRLGRVGTYRNGLRRVGHPGDECKDKESEKLCNVRHATPESAFRQRAGPSACDPNAGCRQGEWVRRLQRRGDKPEKELLRASFGPLRPWGARDPGLPPTPVPENAVPVACSQGLLAVTAAAPANASRIAPTGDG
jgi:hypothetical protein